MFKGIILGFLLSFQIAFVIVFDIKFGSESPLITLPVISAITTIVFMIYTFINDGDDY